MREHNDSAETMCVCVGGVGGGGGGGGGGWGEGVGGGAGWGGGGGGVFRWQSSNSRYVSLIQHAQSFCWWSDVTTVV